VVVHKFHHPNVKGLSSGANAVPRKEKMAKIFLLLSSSGSTGVKHLLYHPNVEGLSEQLMSPGESQYQTISFVGLCW